jgi:hypothetical protein
MIDASVYPAKMVKEEDGVSIYIVIKSEGNWKPATVRFSSVLLEVCNI